MKKITILYGWISEDGQGYFNADWDNQREMWIELLDQCASYDEKIKILAGEAYKVEVEY